MPLLCTMNNKCTIISQIITLLLNVSTLSCHPQGACNQYLVKLHKYQVADKSLARPGRKQARKHVSDAHDFNNIETRAVIKFFPLQGKALKEIHVILTETLVFFRHGRAKDLSAPLYYIIHFNNIET